MAKTYAFRFTVEGSGPFPLDMLRRDRAFPRTEDDANRAQYGTHADGTNGVRRVEMTTLDRPVYWMPTTGRWESYGWRVAAVERCESAYGPL